MGHGTAALIDGDIVVHRIAAAFDSSAEQTGFGAYQFDAAGALYSAQMMVKRIMDSISADKAVFCLSDRESNFRKSVMPTYKANRTGRKPIIFTELRHMMESWGELEIRVKPGLEADDVMGILATMNTKCLKGYRKVICSIDKDLRTIPGELFNWDKHDSFTGPDVISEAEADMAFMVQILAGDSTDGYAGCPGVGPVKANKILKDAETLEERWQAIVGAYENAGLSSRDAITTARVARILRAGEFDGKTKQPILWNPPEAA
jgi:DNA polymerase-1